MPKKEKDIYDSEPNPNISDADRRIRQAAKLADILKLLNLLRGNGRWNVAALAKEFECSERTIRRHLKVLEFAGIPVFYDPSERCHRLRSDFVFPVVNLTPEEMLGQAIATLTTKVPGLDISDGAEPTTINLAATNEEMQEILAQAGELVEVLGLQLADHSQHHSMIRSVQHALLNGKQIRGLYRSPYRDKDFELQIEPYRLCLIKQAWYIVGLAEGMTKPHTYRVARFKSLKMIELNASIPDDFTLNNYLGNAWAVFRGETRYDVELKFEPEAALLVSETQWHATQQVKTETDGAATFKYTVDGLDEILSWILGWTGRVEILNPPELRDLYRKQLERGLEMHPE